MSPPIGKTQPSSGIKADHSGGSEDAGDASAALERRLLRSRYLAVKNLISDKRDDISSVNSEKFNSIINQVESLHHLVRKPREQVADAEALLDITSTLMSSLKSLCNQGVTPSEYVTCLIRDFEEQGEVRNSIDWNKIGRVVLRVFKRAPGCRTMLGPMNVEIKQRAVGTRKRHTRPTERSRPQELDETSTEDRKETDKNMATMFDILKKNRRVRLERLVLNRNSFAETVENIFALSFLVKDGRAEITTDKGYHLVSPKNAPAANAIASGEASYSHFIFRFDFKDWKFMMLSVGDGEDLMPNRNPANISDSHTTPIRVFSRNRSRFSQATVVEDSPESGNLATKATAICKGD